MHYLRRLFIISVLLLPQLGWSRQFSTIEFDFNLDYGRAIFGEQPIQIGDAILGKMHVSDDGLVYKVNFYNFDLKKWEEVRHTIFLKPTDKKCGFNVAWTSHAIEQVILRSLEQRIYRMQEDIKAGKNVNLVHLNLVRDVRHRVFQQVYFPAGWIDFNYGGLSLNPSDGCRKKTGSSKMQFHSEYDEEDEEALHLKMHIKRIYHSN